MLVLLRANIFSNQCLALKVLLQLVYSISTALFLDLFKLIEPDVGHLSSESEPLSAV